MGSERADRPDEHQGRPKAETPNINSGTTSAWQYVFISWQQWNGSFLAATLLSILKTDTFAHR